MVDFWTQRKRPLRLERRIEFPNYDATRDFLDFTGDLSEREDFYPDLNFGSTHVSMTIQIEDEKVGLTDKQKAFIDQVNEFAPGDAVKPSLDGDFTEQKGE